MDLKGEYADWRDHMPDSLRDGDRALEIEDAIEQFENIEGHGEPCFPLPGK